MITTLLGCTLLLATAAGEEKTESPRQPHPFAPSLPKLTREEEKKLDEIIDRFIQYDTGQLRGEAGLSALRDFEALTPEAIPALLRGLNRTAALNHSCPVTVIDKKLRRLIGGSTDIKLIEFARQEVGAGVTGSVHAGRLQDLRVALMLHKNALLRQGLATTGTGRKAPRQMTTQELLEAAGKEKGPALRQVLAELGQRPGTEPLGTLALATGDSDTQTQELARTLLQGNLVRQTPAVLKQALKHEQPAVRQAAARAAIARNLPFVAEYIDLLADEDETVRGLAHQTLVRLARGTDHGPAPGATAEERDKAVARWRTWWRQQGGR